MALKGTTKIELTNVKTGEVEVIEKHNLVTNAVPSLLENPFAWQLKSQYLAGYFAGNILPLCPNLFGGILLYEDAIPENVDQLYAQPDNKLIGYSSNNVNDKTDIMRGSMNQNESGALEDGSGYRFVFDFTTAQANGTISALGLTSKWGGIAGCGSADFKNTQSPKVFFDSVNNSAIGFSEKWAYANALCYDENTGIITSAYVSGQNKVCVQKIQANTKSWKLRRSMSMVDYTQVQPAEYLETTVFASASTSNAHRYCAMCDGGDGYIWGFEHANNADGNSSGKASVNWIKIKLEDLSFEEGTWQIDAQIYRLGYQYTTPGQWVNRTAQECNAVVLGGYLYCINYGKTGLYKINLSNVTDISFFEHPNKNIIIPGKGTIGNIENLYYGFANLAVAGNKVCMWNGYLNKDEIVRNACNVNSYADGTSSLNDGWIDQSGNFYPQRQCIGMHNIKMGAFSIGYNPGNSAVHAYMLLDAPYLATINNLPAPVQKTADKTMKITYILREE